MLKFPVVGQFEISPSLCRLSAYIDDMRFRLSEEDGTHKCSECGAHYNVSYDIATPAREAGTVICTVCNASMGNWNSTREPLFSLISE